MTVFILLILILQSNNLAIMDLHDEADFSLKTGFTNTLHSQYSMSTLCESPGIQAGDEVYIKKEIEALRQIVEELK